MDKGSVTQPLTKEFLQASNVLFRPKTEAEVRVILRTLFKMGFAWGNDDSGDRQAIKHVADCISKGMIAKGGESRIYTEPKLNYPHYLAMATNFPGVTAEDFLSSEELQTKRFNMLAAKVDALDKKIDRLIDLIEPKPIGKKGLEP